MTTSRCPRSRSTRRDPLPHALRFVRHRPWLFRFCVLRLLRGLVVILGRLSKCYSFFLAFPSAVGGVGALGVLMRWEYYLYLSLASVEQGLPPAWGLRRTLSERPLEGPVKREKGLGILSLTSHHSEVREALEGAAFA